MNDNDKSKDQTEAIWAPMVRLYATVEGDSAPSSGNARAELDQTEPCDFAPLIRLQAEVDEEPDTDSENMR